MNDKIKVRVKHIMKCPKSTRIKAIISSKLLFSTIFRFITQGFHFLKTPYKSTHPIRSIFLWAVESAYRECRLYNLYI